MRYQDSLLGEVYDAVRFGIGAAVCVATFVAVIGLAAAGVIWALDIQPPAPRQCVEVAR